MAEEKKKVSLKDFPPMFWLVVLFEFFERGSYYGMMSILSVYLTDQLNFTKESVGLIKSTIQPLLYFLPILAGAIADRMGYRRTLTVAFSLLGIGYFLTSQTTAYSAVFFSLVIMGLGAGTFKPIISGTIAKVTDENTSSVGFGIFYWSINLGAFLFPMFLVPYLKSMDWSYVMIASAIFTGAMVIPTLLFFREPKREEKPKESLGTAIKEIFSKIAIVFMDWRFILFIFLYSLFWILYFQMFDSVLWYVKAFVDPTPLNSFVYNTFGINWSFDVEHVTVINALTIILLQILISALVRNARAFPTMITGISIATLGMAILSVSTSIWVFIAGIFIFSIGEMTAHPKYISYLGLIAPPDKKATYMGFGFLYGFFGSSIGGIVGAFLYVAFIDNPMIAFIREKLAASGSDIVLPAKVTINEALAAAEQIGLTKEQVAQYAHPSELWLIFAGIGVLCIISLFIYEKLIGTRDTNNNNK
ncbi:MAG TPA: MFS transporter [Candidatus Kapabacteria bacterium]|jgi:POT family proton-dependent oligopeptide transporter|nr:MFS transporter [Candidatus Kapabacteria bacterium]HPU23273.1 MFS transporter [Candidatus Kapabacteria bacterium]